MSNAVFATIILLTFSISEGFLLRPRALPSFGSPSVSVSSCLCLGGHTAQKKPRLCVIDEKPETGNLIASLPVIDAVKQQACNPAGFASYLERGKALPVAYATVTMEQCFDEEALRGACSAGFSHETAARTQKAVMRLLRILCKRPYLQERVSQEKDLQTLRAFFGDQLRDSDRLALIYVAHLLREWRFLPKTRSPPGSAMQMYLFRPPYLRYCPLSNRTAVGRDASTVVVSVSSSCIFMKDPDAARRLSLALFANFCPDVCILIADDLAALNNRIFQKAGKAGSRSLEFARKDGDKMEEMIKAAVDELVPSNHRSRVTVMRLGQFSKILDGLVSNENFSPEEASAGPFEEVSKGRVISDIDLSFCEAIRNTTDTDVSDQVDAVSANFAAQRAPDRKIMTEWKPKRLEKTRENFRKYIAADASIFLYGATAPVNGVLKHFPLMIYTCDTQLAKTDVGTAGSGCDNSVLPGGKEKGKKVFATNSVVRLLEKIRSGDGVWGWLKKKIEEAGPRRMASPGVITLDVAVWGGGRVEEGAADDCCNNTLPLDSAAPSLN
uniref:Uncharacterized protein n=1 Tax=Chromera velia CCMP2878 TaxID=1169474 RepID=A0A0G4HV47_9ALVE|eukprot:Cvel_32131.t1-p1 / transcript=Cvel_32131.t1 / gene=Cvel_32131 / organism=Chromera_velia_CCMP2878 / gene_product=hypothetical protein / transcript_product=hypothetical protein / location=Cvel_scaffold4925:2787-4445(-) / protein_length=553 / sequence_SO=supercontig / SO=protein_coding / is_pseudo=false